MLETIAAACRSVHADRVLLESVSATLEECCRMADCTIWDE